MKNGCGRKRIPEHTRSIQLIVGLRPLIVVEWMNFIAVCGVWKLAQDRIPSMQNLAKRCVPLQSMICKGCNKEVEFGNHLFFQCEIFSTVWKHCLKWWGLEAPLQGDCKSHFYQFADFWFCCLGEPVGINLVCNNLGNLVFSERNNFQR